MMPSALVVLAAPCLLATLCLLLPTSTWAQQQSTLPGFSEVIDVRVVNLEVVVTDRAGNRIHGLSPEDFVLRVDGQEVAIDYFSEIQEGTTQAQPSSGSVPSVPSLEPGTRLRTNYLIFVDDFFAIARDRNRVLDRLQQDLELSSPRDRFAIVAFDGKKLDLISSWTSDHQELRTALDLARARKAYGQQRMAELRTNDDQRRQRREQRQLTVQAEIEFITYLAGLGMVPPRSTRQRASVGSVARKKRRPQVGEQRLTN